MLVILGITPVTRTVGRGEFACPECDALRPYAHHKVQQRFVLFFVAVLPLDELGEYIECQRCRGTFRPTVLDREAPAPPPAAEFRTAFLRIMLLMMLQDGRIESSERRMIQDVHQRLSGRELSDGAIEEHLDAVVIDGLSAQDYACEVAPLLNDLGKEMVLKAAFSVAVADGLLHASERELCQQIGRALAMSSGHIEAVLSESMTAAAELLGEGEEPASS
jgi:DnaJ-domain-containing protein 1